MTRVRGARCTPPGNLLAGTPQARPEVKECRSRAPRGAPSGSQREAARLASVPGWFAATPGASQAPAFLGAPLPSPACRVYPICGKQKGSVEGKADEAHPARHDKRAAKRWRPASLAALQRECYLPRMTAQPINNIRNFSIVAHI